MNEAVIMAVLSLTALAFMFIVIPKVCERIEKLFRREDDD